VSHLFAQLLAFVRHPRLREVLIWCAPALVVAVGIRIALCVSMPYAYFHDDAPDFISTADKLMHEHKWELHEKKTFLVPAFFAATFALPFPTLVSIPILQHVLGLGLIVLVGALCRFWFTSWKLFIVPLTLLTAVNPFYLWFEHTLMAETTFVFCTVLVALAGTLYVRSPTFTRLVFLCVALVLEAGARPEGKLLFGFALFVVVLVHWGDLRNSWRRPGLVALIAVITHFATKTEQAGLLLYTSVARLTPVDPSSAPGFEPYIAPIRADLQHRWEQFPQFPRVRDRKAIYDTIEEYLKVEAKKMGKRKHPVGVNRTSFKLARETCLKNFGELPGLALIKFKLVATQSPAGPFDNNILFGKQRDAFDDNVDRNTRLSKRLTGQHLPDEGALQRFVDENYGEVPWFNQLSAKWLEIVNAWRLPDKTYPNPERAWFPIVQHGVPFYFLAGVAGAIAAMLIPGPLRKFHIAWGLTLCGYFFVIMLTANVRPRFRIVFEPFWFMYIAMLADGFIRGIKRVAQR
jgi:hypothetical protein